LYHPILGGFSLQIPDQKLRLCQSPSHHSGGHSLVTPRSTTRALDS
jgi:hypothetical protein